MAGMTVMSIHADASTARHTQSRGKKILLSCVCMFLFVLFCALRFRFLLSFETPTLSQAGVCLRTVQLGFMCVFEVHILEFM